MCPEVKDLLIASNIPGLPQNTGFVDGYERRRSYHIKPGLVVDYGYGINGATHLKSSVSATNPTYTVATTSISTADANTVALRKVTSLKRPADFVLIYDGVAWNPGRGPQRISGGRHGTQYTGDRVADPNWWNKYGSANVLVDGHAQSVPRADLPATGAQVTGSRAQMRTLNNPHVFSTNQVQ